MIEEMWHRHCIATRLSIRLMGDSTRFINNSQKLLMSMFLSSGYRIVRFLSAFKQQSSGAFFSSAIFNSGAECFIKGCKRG